MWSQVRLPGIGSSVRLPRLPSFAGFSLIIVVARSLEMTLNNNCICLYSLIPSQYFVFIFILLM